MIQINASVARKEFAEALNRVAFGRERIVLERRGKKVAALVPLEDLAILEGVKTRRPGGEPGFMRLAGALTKGKDLSSRRGFSRK